MIALDLELLTQLAIHDLNDLPSVIDQPVHRRAGLLVVRAPGAGDHSRARLRPQFRGGCYL